MTFRAEGRDAEVTCQQVGHRVLGSRIVQDFDVILLELLHPTYLASFELGLVLQEGEGAMIGDSGKGDATE